MSGVFPPGTRPDQWGTIGDHQRRIQALEATDPSGEIEWEDAGTTTDLHRVMQLKIIADATTLTTGDAQIIFVIPTELNGMNLVACAAYVSTVSASGLPTVQIRNVTQAVDMLTTKITIDAGEFTSYTATTPPVIDAGNADVATGDLLAIDVDVAGTGAKGLGVVVSFS